MAYCGLARLIGAVGNCSQILSRTCSTFVQDHPRLKNTYLEDVTLKSYVTRYVPAESNDAIHKDLEAFGETAAVDLPPLARQCEVEKPWLEQFDAYGQRVDRLHVSAAWGAMHGISATQGLVATAYENHGDYSRLYQACKLVLFASASGLYSCPLAMTDGAVKILQSCESSVSSQALSHLLSRSPVDFWTSGQWMTEKEGGSDVAAGTATVATGDGGVDSDCLLTGYKWFTSASDAHIALTLARSVDGHGVPISGNKGLSLYYVDVKQNFADGRIQAQRLKDKLGTRQLPTAELLLDECSAVKLSDTGRGIASISPMLTITRLHNAISSVSAMRRMLLLARDYSTRRRAFGCYIRDHPLHVQTLARMEVECRGCTVMVLEVARLLGLLEKGKATTQQEALLRILVPLAKLYTGKQAVAVVSEGLEAFGGLGYLEDTGLPTMLRDAQVLPIWEGTTNILSLDTLRAMASTQNKAFQAAIEFIQNTVEQHTSHQLGLSDPCSVLAAQCRSFSSTVAQLSPDTYSVAARDFAFSLSRLTIGALLIDHAAWTKSPADVEVAKRWCSRADIVPLTSLLPYCKAETALDMDIVFAGYSG